MKYEVWINLYPDYGYYVYPSKEQADSGAARNRIECRKIEWESNEPVRVADYLVPEIVGFARRRTIYHKQTHPVGQQPEGSVMVSGSERSQE